MKTVAKFLWLFVLGATMLLGRPFLEKEGKCDD